MTTGYCVALFRPYIIAVMGFCLVIVFVFKLFTYKVMKGVICNMSIEYQAFAKWTEISCN